MNSGETVSIAMRDSEGRSIATLRIAATSGDARAITMLSREVALRRGEACCQLQEGETYEYRLESSLSGADIAHEERVIRPHSAFPGSGRIDARNAVGLITIRLLNRGTEVGSVDVEIVSSKIDYREQYRAMLADIVDHAATLILDTGSAQRVRFRATTRSGTQHTVLRAEFLIATVQSSRFRSAVERVLAAPESRLVVDHQRRPIERIGRVTGSTLRQLTGPGPRREAPAVGFLASRGLSSITSHVLATTRRESVDIDENRFVKHVLRQFSSFLEEFSRSLLREDPSHRLRDSVRRTAAQLGLWLSHSVMQEAGPLRQLPLGSPTLQRREGYREILGTWVMFNAVSELQWHGGDHIFAAGRRDLASLYEFWVFFQLFDLFTGLVAPSRGISGALVSSGMGGPELRLERGRSSTYEGQLDWGRPLRIRFSYNKTFGSVRDRARLGSWTRSMRPDFTFTLWPAELELEDAERLELSVHVHFDAKYRVLQLEQLLGSDDDEQQKPIDSHDYNRNDLIKMHAYRDAIRRSYGAYVIYPGQGAPREFRSSVGGQLDEVLPGLGAFPLVPGAKAETGKRRIQKFLKDVLLHATDQASARERISYSTHRTLRDLRSPLPLSAPEQHTSTRRITPPSDRSVLLGWCRGPEHLDWIRTARKYNLRTGARTGAVRPTPEWLRAEFLLLHGQDTLPPRLFRISDDAFEVCTRRQLLEEGYPFHGPLDDLYLVLHVQDDEQYEAYHWNVDNLISDHERRGHPTLLRFDDVLRASSV